MEILTLLSDKIDSIVPAKIFGPMYEYNPSDILEGQDTSIYCDPNQIDQIIRKANDLLVLENPRKPIVETLRYHHLIVESELISTIKQLADDEKLQDAFEFSSLEEALDNQDFIWFASVIDATKDATKYQGIINLCNLASDKPTKELLESDYHQDLLGLQGENLLVRMECIAESNAHTLSQKHVEINFLPDGICFACQGSRIKPGEHCQRDTFDNDVWTYWSLMDLQKVYPDKITINGRSSIIARELRFDEEFREKLKALYCEYRAP